jgi:hypothetical protein
MQVQAGDIVRLRDGRIVSVTEASDTHPDAWRTYSKSAYDRDESLVVTSEVPAETILVGKDAQGNTVVTDFSEVTGHIPPWMV